PVINRPGQFGDQIVTLHLEVPYRLNDDQKNLLREFERSCDEKNYRKRGSFFQKLKNLFTD
ncbi:MAG TPA: molecular chaperone DnaJ, partial [Clostridiaceae bacterium]|nr:molecular chaperone DnaJ [Clostridiaceae bacterium]